MVAATEGLRFEAAEPGATPWVFGARVTVEPGAGVDLTPGRRWQYRLPHTSGRFLLQAAVRVDGDLAERLAAVEPEPAELEALATLATAEPVVRARLLALTAAARVGDASAREFAWDPRLRRAVAIAGAITGRFVRAGVELPAARSVPGAPGDSVADRVRRVRRDEVGGQAAVQAAIERLGGAAGPLLAEMHAALLQVARECEAVADHAQGIVAVTLDPQMGARYRRLADSSAELAAAARAATDDR